MAAIRVSADDVAQLGRDLGNVAMALHDVGEIGFESVSLGPGESAEALDRVLGEWSLERRHLFRDLSELAEMAHSAGAAYLFVETDVNRAFGGLTR